MSEQGRETEGGRVVLLLLLGLVVLFGGGYVAAHFAAGDNVPRGTTIAGVEVGGRSQDAAVDALRRGLAERSRTLIPVSVDGRPTKPVDPEAAGLGVDLEASVAAAGGERSWEPERLWNYFTGGEDLDPVVTVDETAMQAAVDQLVEANSQAPRDGDVVFEDDRVEVVEPRLGEGVDPEAAQSALEAAYLQDTTVELTSSSAQPDIDDGDVAQALDAFANPALSGPVTLDFGRTRVRLATRDFAPVLALKPRRSELVPDLDEARLIRLVQQRMTKSKRGGKPIPATVRLVRGKPRVIPDKPGVKYQPDDVRRVFRKLLHRPAGKREASVPAKVARADFRTADARKLGIKEQVAAFTTHFPHAAYRNTNIGRAAELVDGTVLKPGETFSLNDTVGKRTRANGFVPGFIILDGVYREDLGGGVSQMATTTFNAMFFAGLKDIEHKTHSFYIDRYPVGREATVAWGSVDLRFKNDTPYGVLITARVTPSTLTRQGAVTVRMWSTDYWDITASTSDRYNRTPESTRHLSGRDCVPNEGHPGFDVDVTRHFRRAGESRLDHDEKFHTTYAPSDTVICE